MTQLLNSAFEKVSQFSETEQNIFARFILDEIENEKKWEHSFANSEDLLAQMADEALEDFNNKKCEKLNNL